MNETWRDLLSYLWYGQWSAGLKMWEGKPMLSCGWLYYDGWHYCLHIGPFWLSVEYPPDRRYK